MRVWYNTDTRMELKGFLEAEGGTRGARGEAKLMCTLDSFLNSDVANGKGGVWGGIFHLLR